LKLELPLPGLYNVYNALAAVAAGLALGIEPARIATALGEARSAFGRVETIAMAKRRPSAPGAKPVTAKSVSILLIKNPAGANEVLRTLLPEADSEGLDLWIGLNDRIADGRDVSWIWDADFELLAGAVRRVYCSGTRAAEMALRLKYAGWPQEAIEVEPDVETSLDLAVAGARGRLLALPTYTALLELRKLLASRGLAKEFWQ
jgi:UDP-N-acetylmuramyl tripeptide synthase